MNTRSKSSKISTLRRLISLKPYGDELLTPMVASWIFIVTVLVLIMASSEALSWAYFASFFFNDWHRFPSAGITGAIVFFVVWSVDVSLLTLDRGKAHYEQHLYGHAKASSWKEFSKTGVGIALRLVIVMGSLYFTSPYLTQLIFTRDISKELERQTRAQVIHERNAIEVNYDNSINSLQTSLDKLGGELTDEIAGRETSRTKQFGDGPVAKSIRTQIKDKQDSLDELTANKKQELDSFDKAVADHNTEELGNRWGMVLPENSITKRSEVLDKIKGLPMFWQTSLAIKGFLAFLFFAMVILKLFEPRGVRIYLSEAMQQEWQRYRGGAFDAWLRHYERSNAAISTMTPYRFDDVMVHAYSSIRNADLARIQHSTTEREAKEGIETLRDIENDMPEVVQKIESLEHELSNTEDEISKIVLQQGVFPATVNEQHVQVDRLEHDLSEIHLLVGNQSKASVPDIKTLKTASEAALRTNEQLAIARTKLNQLNAQKALYDVQLMPLYERRKQLLAGIDELQAKLDKIAGARDEILDRRIASAVDLGIGRVA